MFNEIIAVIDTNISNVTENFARWSFQPFLTALGQFTYPFFFLLLLGIMWTSVQSHRIVISSVFMIILGFLGYVLFALPFALLFQFIGIASTAWILYLGFFKKGEYF